MKTVRLLLLFSAALGVTHFLACSRSGDGGTAPRTPHGTAAAQAAEHPKEAAPPPIPVEKVALDPDAYPGLIAVSGRVTGSDPARHQFTLGCEDADSCVLIPVHFAGQEPAASTEVIVRGRLAKNPQGQYAFEADSVERP